ncbi:MAG: nucleotide exchange factor GrpE [Actinomycetota bacterium]
MSSPHRPLHDTEQERVVIRDKRRIDPLTGEPRLAPGGEPRPAPGANIGQSEPTEVQDVPNVAAGEQLAERTADLQRVQAEFANYRKRVERDRHLSGELAVGGVLAALLPVLDDIDRARTHGDLTGPLKAVADQLDAVLGKLGLQPFGEVGDTFDPSMHEAVMHEESEAVDAPTTTTIMRRGYKHGERLLRPAMVGVTDPAASRADEPAASGSETDDD